MPGSRVVFGALGGRSRLHLLTRCCLVLKRVMQWIGHTSRRILPTPGCPRFRALSLQQRPTRHSRNDCRFYAGSASFRLHIGYRHSRMAPKQATLGYVKPAQSTIGCVRRRHSANVSVSRLRGSCNANCHRGVASSLAQRGRHRSNRPNSVSQPRPARRNNQRRPG